ncbi:ATP-binding protein [Pantoea sp. At-9b]|jgi:AAA+ ATPase superfamily predicted ATPase|uniref:ATP-binding protein n=1 Tax=Pantoea sp. (strain At-9b) TaxID=592316 RepID=UPI0001F25F6C|nr:ATP-binding protein [Pantoea sp. At-9b]ADU72435.1 AAA ATPase [Pantoea sp. At-9b]
MNRVMNPFSPGAGAVPMELAGRGAIQTKIAENLERIRIGRNSQGVILVGLRGVGKTVLLQTVLTTAEDNGFHTINIEASERKSLPAMLAPDIRTALLRLSRIEEAKDLAQRGLAALAGFASKLKVTYNDIEVGLDLAPEPGLADNGDLEIDLTALLEQVGIAAQKAKTALVIFIDELQYIQEKEMSALISALHRCAQKKYPITVVAAGLPQLRGRMGDAKSYAERLFEFVDIGPLNKEYCIEAIRKPIEAENESINDDAINCIFENTYGYPYFIQEWGSHTWNIADVSPITKEDVELATPETIAKLDASFFMVRFDRLTPKEKEYLKAMAILGPGPHRSGDIASELDKNVKSLGPVRQSLIDKGMIWSPSHGDTAFTVPLFDQFLNRIMP